jgi:uncharacterized repeat protein (TIGR03803 family)
MIRISMAIFALFCGVAFVGTAASSQAASYRVRYAFHGGSDGSEPQTSLIYVSGMLYGTTLEGGSMKCGSDGCGTVFSLNPATGAEQVTHAFRGGSDGFEPQAGLIYVGGTMYGTTFEGGSTKCSADGCGTVFSINPATGAEQVVRTFDISDGANPEAGLTNVGATLYGTILNGGTIDFGTVFSLNPTTGVEQVMHSFQGGSDGAYPTASLIYVGGMLYGTTRFGGPTNCGANGCGTIFSLDPTSGAERVLHSFQSGDGAYPYANLINVGGTLYGTTSEGGDSTKCGADGCGTVFSLKPATGVETVVYSFKGDKDGSSPSASLVSVGGRLYGTTRSGGSSGDGTVFSLNPTTGAEKVVHSFKSGSDGAYSDASLIDVGGTLYGTTESGGSTTCSCGTVFALTP